MEGRRKYKLMKQKRSSVESRKAKGPTVQLLGARWSDASLSEVVRFERPGARNWARRLRLWR